MCTLLPYQVHWLDEDAVLPDGSPDMLFVREDSVGDITAAIRFARSVSRRNAVVFKIITTDGRVIDGAELKALMGFTKDTRGKLQPRRLP